MNTATETAAQQRVKITLPSETMERYERLATEERKTLDQVLSERLTQCVDHKARKGFWIGDTDRANIEDATKASIGSASDLVGLVRKAMRVGVGSVNISLGIDLADRLKSRCFDTQGFDKWLSKRVIEGLEEFAGLR